MSQESCLKLIGFQTQTYTGDNDAKTNFITFSVKVNTIPKYLIACAPQKNLVSVCVRVQDISKLKGEEK